MAQVTRGDTHKYNMDQEGFFVIRGSGWSAVLGSGQINIERRDNRNVGKVLSKY